jgi:hypothetical protein
MALTENQFGGIDLLATVKEFDKRLTELEAKVFPPAVSAPVAAVFVKEADGSYKEIPSAQDANGAPIYNLHPDGTYTQV